MWLTRMLYSFITERLIAIYRYNNLCQFVSANIVPLCGFSNDVVVITCHSTAAAPRKYKTRLRQFGVSHLTKTSCHIRNFTQIRSHQIINPNNNIMPNIHLHVLWKKYKLYKCYPWFIMGYNVSFYLN